MILPDQKLMLIRFLAREVMLKHCKKKLVTHNTPNAQPVIDNIWKFLSIYYTAMFTSAELQHREHLIKQILHLSDAKDYYDLADTLDSHSTEYLEQELQKLKDKVPINYQQEKLLRTLFGL